MLNLEATRIDKSQEFNLKTGVTVTEEGLILVQDTENGGEVAKLATGTGDVFLGFSYGQTLSPVTKSLVEELTVPSGAPYTVTLQREPIAGQIYIVNSGGTPQTAGDPALNPNEYSISGKVITFHSGQADDVETITYRYSPTVEEVLSQDATLLTSVSPNDLINQMGAIKKGDVYTNQFNAGAAYAVGNAVGMAANGLPTATGANDIPGAYVIKVPTVDSPFLGIRIP